MMVRCDASLRLLTRHRTTFRRRVSSPLDSLTAQIKYALLGLLALSVLVNRE